MVETKTDKEALEDLEGEMKELRAEKAKITQKTRFIGTYGVWGAFRSIGKTYYNQKGMTSEQKTAKLKSDIESFVKERL